MISVTNDLYSFMKQDTPLFIYGAAKTGNWCGQYMNELNIQYDGYLDKNGNDSIIYLNDHQIIRLQQLDSNYTDFRIIIASNYYEQILTELLFESNINQNIICYVPRYNRVLDEKRQVYNVNRLMAFFRKKKLKCRFPTIICNDCTGGLLYELFDSTISTPFINTGIGNKDYIKLLMNLDYYLKQDIKTVKCWDYIAGREAVEGRIDDIRILFGHDKEPEKVTKRWNLLKERIDRENLLVVMTDRFGMPSLYEINTFISLPFKKSIIFSRKNGAIIPRDFNAIYLEEGWFFSCTDVIENHFDIISWINETMIED